MSNSMKIVSITIAGKLEEIGLKNAIHDGEGGMVIIIIPTAILNIVMNPIFISAPTGFIFTGAMASAITVITTIVLTTDIEKVLIYTKDLMGYISIGERINIEMATTRARKDTNPHFSQILGKLGQSVTPSSSPNTFALSV